MDIEAVLLRHGGTASRAALVESGMSTRRLAAAVADGALVRGRRGQYASPRLPPEVLTAFRIGGRLGATDAARSHGLWVLRSPQLHVHVVPNAARIGAPRGVRLHWDPAWPDDEPLRVSPPHSLLQLGRSVGVEDMLVAVESAREQRLVSRDDLVELRRLCPVRLHEVLDFCRDDAQSGLESLARWRLHLLGITAVAQAWIPGVGRVDLLIGRSLIVELDGRSTHDFENDRRRDTAAAVDGYVTLRFSAAQVLTRWPEVERAIVTAISRGLHRL
ncbi:type IV toxin-antitoxin system AbiEi family antitoxin domain-containing protein [Rathayibacter sp. SD072]|uniref:type IV toxin-antitoxin system AbiEi family antitoxin domain-containing protein n=1 Tax=Rathayibacter sp. SD072 TaxID=2781731 RepID=UPI001A973838|nr:type IV toxin-antitoxin system AbiEi family antitoxin domain-containing protein [Rathayibacter sp. SD072]MBO0983323.1 type IV toxin-antitoxin system AbiEi family antitoxin domain-containing protein [Rathayibacter sp. SD072]